MVKDFREGAVKDILDTIKDIQDTFGSDNKPKRRHSGNNIQTSSISRASKDLIMSFPVLCDDSLEPQTASMICKAIERKCVTMLQLVFASCAFNGNNGREILAQWHNNIGDSSSYTLDDYLDLCDRFEESYNPDSDKLAINEAVKQMKIEMKDNKSYPVSSFSESSINQYPVTARYGDIVVMEAPNAGNGRFFDTRSGGPSMYPTDNDMNIINYNKSVVDMIDNQASRAIQRQYQDKQIAGYNNDFLKKQLMDNDAKKCNELVPSLMIVKFQSDNGNGTSVENQFICGVKARLIPMDTYEIIERIQSKNKDRQGFLNFVRATTREIAFVKDYLLAIDKAKIEAKNNSIRNQRNSRIWKTLEKRATKSVWKRMNKQTNTAACITSLVISQQAANTLRKEYGVNIADIRTATTIMDAYNLLALVIVDESTEVARFLFDGDSSYEDLSFNSLERESGDGSYKKVINLLSKMNGR